MDVHEDLQLLMEGLPTAEKENNPPEHNQGNYTQENPVGTAGSNFFKSTVTQLQTDSRERQRNSTHPQETKGSPKQKSQEQMQLVEKFKKLRQWQQQQQESLLRQQQQQIETVKMGQSKLQGILAAQRLLYEQSGQEQKTLSSNSPKHAFRPTGPLNALHNSTSGRVSTNEPRYGSATIGSPGTVPTESLGAQNLPNLPRHYVPNTGADVESCGYFPRATVMPCLGHLPPGQPSPTFVDQTASSQGRVVMDRTSAVLNDNVYPVPWSSSNFQLPLGSIPLSSNAVLPFGSAFQQQGPSLHMPGSGNGQVSAVVGKAGEVFPATVMQQNAVNLVIPTAEPYPEGYRSSPSGSSQPCDLESQDDDLSEVDVMSGVYPIDEGSCSEMDEAEDKEQRLLEEESENLRQNDTSEGDSDYDDSNSNMVTVIEEPPSPGGDQNPEGVPVEQVVDDEERPINPGIGTGSSLKTFEDLLEEQLRLEEIKSAPVSLSKPRQTFLRKGQGLARFRGKKEPSKGTTKCPMKQPPGPKTLGQPSATQTKEACLKKVPTDADSGLLPPQSKLTRKVAGRSAPPTSSAVVTSRAGAAVFTAPSSTPINKQAKTTYITKTIQSTQGDTQSGKFPSQAHSLSPRTARIDSSFQARLQELDKAKEMEDEDLEEFEMLEQAAAANASFSSNSSVVVRVLQKARVRHQGVWAAEPHGNLHKDQDGAGGILSPVDTGYGSGEGKAVPGTDSAEFSANAPPGSDSEDSEADVTLVETSESSPGGEGTSGERGSGQQVSQTRKAVTQSSLSEDFDDEESWDDTRRESESESSDDSDVTIGDVFPVVASTPPLTRMLNGEKRAMTSTPPTSALVSKLFPQLKPKARELTDQAARPPEKSREPVNDTPQADGNKNVTMETTQSAALREKLQELDNEIERFRAENANLEKLRVEREEGLKRLQGEITSFENQKTQELERLQKFKEEELQKLRKEKRVFDKYRKASRAVPDKKEREEIESLKNQVTELQEELKRRESRWSAASARYRNRVDSVEQRNKELQEEVKMLERYRLQSWHKQETNKVKDAEETRKTLQRKSTRIAEEDVGGKTVPSHRPAPRKAAFADAVVKPVQDDTFSPVSREYVDPNNNQATVDESSIGMDDKRTDRYPRQEHRSNPPSAGESPRKTRKSPNNGQKRESVRFDENKTQDAVEQLGALSTERSGNQEAREIVHADGKVERIHSDGSRVITFSNGTKKEISADGKALTVTFFNGDIKQILPDQRVMYYYADAQTTHTTYADGLEVLQFPNNQIEKHYPDNTKEIIFPDQTIKYVHPRGTEESVFADGTIQRVNSDGERTIEFPNGQREVHTKHFKKREYPDGTIKTVFPDGRTETRYATGRLRVKDRDGSLLIDTADPNR